MIAAVQRDLRTTNAGYPGAPPIPYLFAYSYRGSFYCRHKAASRITIRMWFTRACVIQIFLERWIYHQHTSRVWWSYNVFFLDPLDGREYKPIFWFSRNYVLQLVVSPIGTTVSVAWCREIYLSIFCQFRSCPDTMLKVRVTRFRLHPSNLNLSKRESELNRCMKSMDLLDSGIYSGHGWVWSQLFLIPQAKARDLSTAIL